MKNKRIEKTLKIHKTCSKQRNGAYFPHTYDHYSVGDKTFWDDFHFYMNGTRYFISFTHPRYAYTDECSDIVYKTKPDVVMFDSCVPEYKRVGKSRKKVTYYVSKQKENTEALDLWWINYKIELDKTLRTSDVVITPSVSVGYYKRSKFIDICVPYEILTLEDAKMFVQMVKGFYKAGELKKWVDGMKNLKYDKHSWIKENEE